MAKAQREKMYLAQMIGVLSHTFSTGMERRRIIQKMSLRNMIFEPFIRNVLLLEEGVEKL